MSTQVQYRRGTAAENDAFTGALAEITVDTTNLTLRVHDGVTPGGTALLTGNTALLNNPTITGEITGDLIPSANITYDIGNSTNYWNNLYLAGNTIFLGSLQLKQVDATTFGVFTGDGTTQADIDVGNIDVAAITQGTSEIGIAGINGNAYVTVNGTGNVLVISTLGAEVSGALSATGNITGDYILGNGSQLTGIDATSIQNGTANVRTFPNGNVTVSAAGVANVFTVTDSGADVLGSFTSSGNVQGQNLVTTGTVDTVTVTASGNVQGQNLVTTGTVDASAVLATGNVEGQNLVTAGLVDAGNIVSATEITALGNITGNYIFGNGSQLQGIDATSIQNGTANVRTFLDANVTISAAGTANVVEISATGANVTGYITATGNITGDYIFGNGSQLQGIDATSIQNGTANVRTFLDGDVTISAAGTANVLTVTSVGANIAGTLDVTGNVTTGNVQGTVGDFVTVIGTLDTASQPNITDLGNLTALIMAGNIDVGNNFIVNLQDPVDAQDAATKNYVDSQISSGFTIEDDTANTTVVSGGDTLQLRGTTDQVTVTITDQDQVTFGLPANVTVQGNVQAGNVSATTVSGSNVDASSSINTNSIVGTGITVTGSTVSFALTGNVTVNDRYINRVANPVQAQDAATKQYVDDAASSGITIHDPVQLLACTFCVGNNYTQGGTVATVTDTVAGNTVVFSTAVNPQVNDQYWFANSFQGILGNVPYFVVSAPNTSAAVLSTAYDGEPVSNITSASSLTESVRINSGQGATITNAGANVRLTIDSTPVTTGDRVLLTAQTNGEYNGVYDVTEQGAPDSPGPGAQWVLTRSQDMDTYIPNDINGLDAGDYFYVQNGVLNKGESWVMTAPTGPVIIGYANLTFTQFSASQVYSANTSAGLALTGTTFSAKVDGVTTDFDGGGNIIVRAGAALTTPNIGAATGTSLAVTDAVVIGGNVTQEYATVTTSVANSQVTLDSWSGSSYRSGRYYCQVSSGTDYQVIELSMIHDAANVFLTQYGEIVTNASLGNFDAQYSGGTVSVLFTPINAVTTVKAAVTLISV